MSPFLAAGVLGGALHLAASLPASRHIEPGLYWDPASSGMGIGVEVQGNTAAVYVMAFDAQTGLPKLYTAAGEIRDDAQSIGPIHDFFAGDGRFPIHWVVADLFEISNGPCLTCDAYNAPPDARSAGRITLWFADTGRIFMEAVVDGEPGVRSTYLRRINFAREEFSLEPRRSLLFVDLAGEWLFENLEQDAPTLRANFDRREPQSVTIEDLQVSYFDDLRGLEMRCAIHPAGDSGSEMDARKTPGCELLVNGEVHYAFRFSDIGLYRMRGAPGILPPMQAEPYRRPGSVVGLRLE